MTVQISYNTTINIVCLEEPKEDSPKEILVNLCSEMFVPIAKSRNNPESVVYAYMKLSLKKGNSIIYYNVNGP